MTKIIDADPTPVDVNTDGIFAELSAEREPEAVVAAEEVISNEPEVPAKFKGKPVEDIVKSYEELEKQFGKQGQELGELRKLTDEFIKRQLQGTPDDRDNFQRLENDRQELDILNDPERALESVIQKRLGPVLNEVQEIRKEKMNSKLQANHPDFVEIIQNPEFADWVKNSKVRTELYLKADQGYDFEAADELFSNWKNSKGIKKKAESKEVDEKARKESFKNATMETGAVGETSPKKIYRRADIINLRMNDPYRYEQLQNEIMTAYAEGRVK